MTWVGLFSTLGYFSLGHVAIHRATTLRGSPWLGPTFGSLVLLTGIVTCLGWGVAIGLHALSDGAIFGGLPRLSLAVGFLSLPFLIWEQYSSALLMAIDHVEVYNRGQMVGRTIGILLVMMGWCLAWGVVGVLSALLVSQGIVACFGAPFLLRRIRTSMAPDMCTIKELMKGATRLHPNYVGGFLMTSCSILIVNHYLGARETGQYQSALQLAGLLLVAPQGASMVMYGRVARLGPDGAWAYQRRIIATVMLATLCGVAALEVLAPWIVHVVLGDRFAPTVTLFQTL